MPNPKRTLSITPCESRKPVAPPDLWERLEQEVSRLKLGAPIIPPGAFTSKQFCEKFSLSRDQAHRRLFKLCSIGKVEKFGHGAGSYYMMKS